MSDSPLSYQQPDRCMFSLFRRKAKSSLSRGRTAFQVALAHAEPRQSEPSSLAGHTIQQLEANEVEHSIRSARLTPEQLDRVLRANDRPLAPDSQAER